MTTCDKCGAEYETPAWPFCPHGIPGSGSHGIATNEKFIGGMTIENLGHEPVVVHSREEFKAAMDKANVEQRIKWVPGDKHLTNWGSHMDPQTLENARILVSRNK